MQLNRFWGSVWSVAALLFGVGLLQYVVIQIVTLFGFLPGLTGLGMSAGISGILPASPAFWVVVLAMAVVPLWGTLTYLDWRWSWKPAHIGAAFSSRAPLWVVAGLVGGVAAALAAHLLSLLLGRNPLALTIQFGQSLNYGALALLLTAPAVELVYRGAVLSRYEADLDGWEVLVAAALTPLAWQVIGAFLGLGPFTGIQLPWMAALSIVLTLLALRTESLWFVMSLRAGLFASLLFLGWSISPTGGLLLFGAIAVLLLLLEWFRERRRPKRMQPRRGSRRVVWGRTVQGPWGPH